MIRILIFLLSIVLVAGTVTYLASLDSRITGEAFGQKIDGPSGLIIGGLAMALLIAIYLTHKIKDIMAMPAKLRAREAETRRNKGVAALTRGLEAVAVGDASDATHHARVAQRHLDDLALTRLLSAQAAQLSGDEAAAHASFSAMLEAPETEFLGLKGLYLQAMAKGERQAAQDFAERAFRLRSNARWAFESVVDLGLDRGAWRETRENIAKGRKNNLIDAAKADRASAALLTADAYAAAASGDDKLAITDAEAAIKLAPGLTPAATLLARLYAEAGKTGKAAKVIEAGFAAAPHPALTRQFDALYTDEEAEKYAARLEKLAEKIPDAREAKLLSVRAHIAREEWSSAARLLEPLLEDSPTAADLTLMARVAAGLSGAEAGRRWLERAASAPRDPRPGADGDFHFTREGWARLVREFMEFGRLSPPPLEDSGHGISSEEIRLLMAPPAPDVEAVDADALDIEAPDVEASKEEGLSDNAELKNQQGGDQEKTEEASSRTSEEDDHIHDDEEAERAAAAAREVS